MTAIFKKFLSYIFNWPVICVYSLSIIISSLMPVEMPEALTFPFHDKVLHGLNYLILAFIVANTLALETKWQNMLFSFLYAFTLGLIIEILQYFIPYRNFDVIDILCNFAGGLSGCLLSIKTVKK